MCQHLDRIAHVEPFAASRAIEYRCVRLAKAGWPADANHAVRVEDRAAIESVDPSTISAASKSTISAASNKGRDKSNQALEPPHKARIDQSGREWKRDRHGLGRILLPPRLGSCSGFTVPALHRNSEPKPGPAIPAGGLILGLRRITGSNDRAKKPPGGMNRGFPSFKRDTGLPRLLSQRPRRRGIYRCRAAIWSRGLRRKIAHRRRGRRPTIRGWHQLCMW
jgi:hypothetical protein